MESDETKLVTEHGEGLISVTIPTLEMQSEKNSKLYIAYFVEIRKDSDVWRVPRRFQDFRLLDRLLKANYRSIAKKLPDLPSRGFKRAFSNKFDPKFTLERRQLLEQYICQVFEQLNVEDCAELDDFVEYSEHMIYFSIDKLASLDGVQDIVETLKHVSENDKQVAAFYSPEQGKDAGNSTVDDANTGGDVDITEGLGNKDEVEKDVQCKRSSFLGRNNSTEIEEVLENTAKKIRMTMERMDSMREDMQAGINTKVSVLEMLRNKLESEQDTSRMIRVSQTNDRSSSENKLKEVQIRIKRLQTEKKLLVGEIKSLKKRAADLVRDKEQYKATYGDRTEMMRNLEETIKNDRKTNSKTFDKHESDKLINDLRSWVEQLKRLDETAASASTVEIQKCLDNIARWKGSGIQLDNGSHKVLSQKLEELLNDNLNIRSSVYKEIIKVT